MDKRDVGPIGAVPRVGGGIDDAVRVADVMVVDQRAERAAELPTGIRGARERRPRSAAKPQRDQLIFRIEVCFRDPADPLRRVVHGAGNFVREALGAPVGPPAVVENHPAAGVHQPLDHGVGVCRGVVGLRRVGAEVTPSLIWLRQATSSAM